MILFFCHDMCCIQAHLHQFLEMNLLSIDFETFESLEFLMSQLKQLEKNHQRHEKNTGKIFSTRTFYRKKETFAELYCENLFKGTVLLNYKNLHEEMMASHTMTFTFPKMIFLLKKSIFLLKQNKYLMLPLLRLKLMTSVTLMTVTSFQGEDFTNWKRLIYDQSKETCS